jgi:predicted nucleic acid-binding protein
VIVVDASVWIDFFNGTLNEPSDELQRLLAAGRLRIVVPDVVLFEVLRGFRQERDHRQARTLLEALDVEATGGRHAALSASQHYRALRHQGHTLRGAMDVWVAAFCIEHDYALLHRDRDFHAMERLRGLKVWRPS